MTSIPLLQYFYRVDVLVILLKVQGELQATMQILAAALPCVGGNATIGGFTILGGDETVTSTNIMQDLVVVWLHQQILGRAD